MHVYYKISVRRLTAKYLNRIYCSIWIIIILKRIIIYNNRIVVFLLTTVRYFKYVSDVVAIIGSRVYRVIINNFYVPSNHLSVSRIVKKNKVFVIMCKCNNLKRFSTYNYQLALKNTCLVIFFFFWNTDTFELGSWENCRVCHPHISTIFDQIIVLYAYTLHNNTNVKNSSIILSITFLPKRYWTYFCSAILSIDLHCS